MTGTWQGTGKSTAFAPYTFNLKQEGPQVTGSVLVGGLFRDLSEAVTGTVAGDVFTFGQTASSKLSGEMKVSGDEMAGTLYIQGQGRQTFTLRRVK